MNWGSPEISIFFINRRITEAPSLEVIRPGVDPRARSDAGEIFQHQTLPTSDGERHRPIIPMSIVEHSLNLAKSTIAELALFGGQPSFEEALHVGRPNIGDRTRLLDRFNQILDSRCLTNDGPFVKEFEQRIAELVG